jgi:hypothetical protein
MYRALMRIVYPNSSNDFLLNDPSKFFEYFDNAQGPLLRKEKNGSPEEVIENIRKLQSLTGRFKLILDVFDPELIAASLIKQDNSAKFISDGWYPVFYGLDSPEGYYYFLRLDQRMSNWAMTYWDPFEKSPEYFSITFNVEVEVTGCHPDIWAGEKKILG